ncbi:hypothetical protein QJQ45_029612, partial [Haematococcus lacustris]
LQLRNMATTRDSDEDDDPVVQLSEDELDKMLFGDNDFTLPSDANGNTAGATAQPTASGKGTAMAGHLLCSTDNSGLSEKLVELTIQALMKQGSQMEPSDVVASLQSVGTVVTGVPNLVPSVAGGVGSTQRAPPASPLSTSHKEEQLMVALANFQAAHPRLVTQPQALGAALLLPHVLLLEQQFIRDRLVRPRQTFQLEEAILSEECCRHPELLLAPFEALESKMTVMKNIMGVTGLPVVQMLTRLMFVNV